MLSDTKSIRLSSILLKIAFVGVIAAAFFVPAIVEWYYPGFDRRSIEFLLMVASMYMLLACGLFIVIKMHMLLKNIEKNEVFVEANVNHLKIISYLCFAASGAFAVMGIVRPFGFVMTAAVAFLGLILRIVRYVIAKAVELREENDTVI